MGFIDDSDKKKLLTFSIVIVVIFLVGLSVYSFKTFNNGYCGTSSNKQIDSLDNVFVGDVIVDDSSYLQEIIIDNQEIPYYEYYIFCFNAVLNSSEPLNFKVVNSEGDTLGVSYLVNDSGYQCIDIGSQDFKVKNNYLGVKCLNCDVNNNFSFMVSSSQTIPTLIDGSISTYSTIDFNLIGVTNCRLITFKLFKYMILFVGLMSLIWLIDLFVTEVDKRAFNGWK